MEYTYLLFDDSGVSNSVNEIIIPINTIFVHEFGVYQVKAHRDKEGKETRKRSEITQIECEQIKK